MTTTFDPHANFVIGVVTVAPSPAASGTTMTLQRVAGFIDPGSLGHYNVAVGPPGTLPDDTNAEVVRLSAINYSTHQMTMARVQEGSTARVISIGDYVWMVVSAKTLTDIEAAIHALEGGSAGAFILGGQPGGQTASGGTGASENLIFHSTAHATKAKIFLGNDFYVDEANQWMVFVRTSSLGTGSNPVLWIEQAGSDDPRITFATVGANLWEAGIDNSDDDAFKINSSTGVGDFTGLGLRIDRTGVVEAPVKLSVGAGATPFTGLDVESGISATYAKFGPSLPVYIIAGNPNLGLNAYYNSGWKFGKGSTSHHAAIMTLDPSGGTLQFFVSSAPGAVGGSVSFASPLLLTSANVRLPLLTSTSVLATDGSGNVVAGSLAGDPNIITVPSGCSAATFQAAINSLGATGGKIILPPGTYDFSATILLPAKNVYIQGSGRGNTVVKSTAAIGTVIEFDPAIGSGTWTPTLVFATKLTFSDITFQADSATSQDVIYLANPGIALVQPPTVEVWIVDCDFKYTDHTTNRSSNMVHISSITGIRFRGCVFYEDVANGTEIHGLGVWIDGAASTKWVQDVRFEDCVWMFINGVYAHGGSGGDCEGIHMIMCHMVGQGRNCADAVTNHYALDLADITDFQWHGGEITSVDGNPAIRIDTGGPIIIDSAYIDGIGNTLIDVKKTNQSCWLFFSHLFTNDDGGGGHPIVLHGSATWGFFGNIHDNTFASSSVPNVTDPGSGGSALSFIQYHSNWRGTSYYIDNSAGVP